MAFSPNHGNEAAGTGGAPSQSSPNRIIVFFFTLVFAVALPGIWSIRLAAIIRKELNPPVPQWILVAVIATSMIGCFMLIGRMMRTRLGQRFSQIMIAALMIPFWGFFLGDSISGLQIE